MAETVRVGASLCQETLHKARPRANKQDARGGRTPEEIADETHLRLDLVRRLAWLHEYSEDLEEPERAHAASDRAKPDRENLDSERKIMQAQHRSRCAIGRLSMGNWVVWIYWCLQTLIHIPFLGEEKWRV